MLFLKLIVLFYQKLLHPHSLLVAGFAEGMRHPIPTLIKSPHMVCALLLIIVVFEFLEAWGVNSIDSPLGLIVLFFLNTNMKFV